MGSVLVGLLCVLTAAADGALTPAQEEGLRAVARGEVPVWPGLSPGQERAVHEKAEAYWSNFRRHHLPHGLSVDILWTSPARTEAKAYEGLGDSACWTGHYLAALALRHRAAPDDATRNEILAVLDKFDLLTTIGGRDGYIARYAGPADDPAYEAYYSVYGQADPGRVGFGKCAYPGKPPKASTVWLGNSSRDTYDGTAFGLAACLKYVDDGEVQARTRALIRRIGQCLVEDEWHIVDGRGGKTPPTALWKLAWMRLAQSADTNEFRPIRKEYEALFEETLAAPHAWDIRGKQDDEYYPNNLAFARFFVLASLESEPEKAEAVKRATAEAYDLVRDHLNAQLAAVYLFVTGNRDDASAMATLEGGLLDFPDPPRILRLVDNRQIADVDEDSVFAKEALLPRDRPVTDFLWQRSPCLVAGGEDAPLEYPGIDVVLPYWIYRNLPKP